MIISSGTPEDEYQNVGLYDIFDEILYAKAYLGKYLKEEYSSDCY